MPRAVFAAEASRAIGGGHVMRSLALARGLMRRGWQCELAARPETFSTFPITVLADLGQRVLGVDEVLPGLFPTDLPDVLVFDRYAALTAAECAWQAAGTTVVVIDDLADQFHHADILLNQNQPDLGPQYASLLPQDSITLFGPEFALLRPEFAAHRESALKRRAVARLPSCVFVNFGLTDPASGCLKAIDALEQLGHPVKVHVAIGAAARDVAELRARAMRSPLDITVHVDAPNVAEIMAASDYAIAAGGGSAWERCALGLASIGMSIADNQDASCALIAERGAGINLGAFAAVSTETLATRIGDIHGDAPRLREMGLAAAAICDGKGVERVADAIELVATSKMARPAYQMARS